MLVGFPCYQKLPSYTYSSKIFNMTPDTMTGYLTNNHLLDQNTSYHSYRVVSGAVEGHVIINIGDDSEAGSDNTDNNDLNVLIGCPKAEGIENQADTQCTDDVFTFEIGLNNFPLFF